MSRKSRITVQVFRLRRAEDRFQVLMQGNRLPKPDLITEELYRIMKNCWNYNSKDRPNFKTLGIELKMAFEDICQTLSVNASYRS